MPSYPRSHSRSEGSTQGVLTGAGAGGLGCLGSLPAAGPRPVPPCVPSAGHGVRGQAPSSLRVRQVPGAPEQGLGRSQRPPRGPGCRSGRPQLPACTGVWPAALRFCWILEAISMGYSARAFLGRVLGKPFRTEHPWGALLNLVHDD